MKFDVIISLTGYLSLSIEADSPEAAHEIASRPLPLELLSRVRLTEQNVDSIFESDTQ